MHELKFEEKVKVWRDLREKIEISKDPLKLLLEFTGRLARSSAKINAFDPKEFIEPWDLVMKDAFNDLEICLLSCYTLQLTDRFSNDKFEIHITEDVKSKSKYYLLIINKELVLGYTPDLVTSINELPKDIISQRIYPMPALH